MHRFSAVSSAGGDKGFGRLVLRSWIPLISPDRRRGLACFLRGSGDWHSCRGSRVSGKDKCDMWGSFNGGS